VTTCSSPKPCTPHRYARRPCITDNVRFRNILFIFIFIIIIVVVSNVDIGPELQGWDE